MKKLLSILLILISFEGISQTWNRVYYRPGYQYNGIKLDSILVTPTDTTRNKLTGSIAVNNNSFLFKDATGWRTLLTSNILSSYRLLNNHDSLSTLQEKNYSSLDGKPDLTIYRPFNNHDSLSTLQEKNYSSLDGLPNLTQYRTWANHDSLSNLDEKSYNSLTDKPTIPTTTADIAASTDKRYVTDAQLVVIGNTSGTNSGDQDLSGKVDKVTGKGLSEADVTSAEKTAITHSNRTALDNVSGTNSGDETVTTIKTKLGITTLSGSNTGDQDLSGKADLDGNGKVLSTQMPTIAITNTFTVASEAAMLALSSAETGDVAVRSDENKSYILQTEPYSTLSNWVLLKSPTDAVLSVNGQTGVISLTTDQISEGTNKYVSAAEKTAITHSNRTALDNVSGTNTGDQTLPTTLPASDVYTWAKQSVKPSYVWTEIGSRPTALSQFSNDLGNYGSFLTTETDPTIYAWAKAATKPTYTYTEVGAQEAGSYAAASHNQAWSTITSTPTTLSGYGIADTPWTAYLPLTGGSLSGNLGINDGYKINITGKGGITKGITFTYPGASIFGGLGIDEASGDFQIHSMNGAGISFNANSDGINTNRALYIDPSKKSNFYGAIETSSTISATGGNSTQWNSAYGWGNHASAGYFKNNGSYTNINANDVPAGWGGNYAGAGNSNFPADYGTMLDFGDGYAKPQLFFDTQATIKVRSGWGGSWGAWRTVYDSGNLTNTLTTNYLPKWNGSSLVNSLISDDGTLVNITKAVAFASTNEPFSITHSSDFGLKIQQAWVDGIDYRFRIRSGGVDRNAFTIKDLGAILMGYDADPTSGNKLAVNGNAYIGGTVTATGAITAPSVNLGSGTGVKLYAYDNGGDLKAGLGIDLYGGSRELSIFHTTSTGSDGRISFGRRLESSGAYTETMSLTGAGNLTATGSGTFTGGGFNSSRKLKDLYPDWKHSALKEINKFKLRDFSYKTDSGANRTLGFIIDEIPNSVKKYAVREGEAVNLYTLHGLSFKAIQELSKENEKLKEQNEDLENRLERLERIVKKIERRTR